MYKDYKQYIITVFFCFQENCSSPNKSPCQGAIGQDEGIFMGLGENTDPWSTDPLLNSLEIIN